MEITMREKSRLRLRIWIATILALFMAGFLPAVQGGAAEGNTTKFLQETDVKVDYSNELITVRANGQDELYYGFAGDGKQLKEYQRIGDNLIATCSDGSASYDAFGCSPWGHKESDMTEQLHFHFSLSCIGEGNGNPLQCSCLENPSDGGAWWAAVYGVAQSWTRLK